MTQFEKTIDNEQTIEDETNEQTSTGSDEFEDYLVSLDYDNTIPDEERFDDGYGELPDIDSDYLDDDDEDEDDDDDEECQALYTKLKYWADKVPRVYKNLFEEITSIATEIGYATGFNDGYIACLEEHGESVSDYVDNLLNENADEEFTDD